MEKPLLNVTQVSYSYGSAPVLEDVTFKLAAGEMAAVVGPNGSGKSTLLKCISGLLHPQQGDITLAGKSISGYSAQERAKQVAVVPQETVLAFDFNVAETVLMGRQPHLRLFQRETAADVAAVQTAMEQTGTRSLAERSVSTLSGGERQRVLIARALAQEPRLLLLDEPTSQLDITYQAEILGLLQRLNSQHGLTILAVIHDLNLAVQYFNKFILLSQGRILATGTAAEVITSDNLQRAYHSSKVQIAVNRHPVHHRPFVTVFPAQEKVPGSVNDKREAVK
ncbi:MAG: heme ABC transporter ATP-binding protein [Firmicutes bacterium]|nr:heme ABC transporter ATP-binding protein [Bacillota bacterium]